MKKAESLFNKSTSELLKEIPDIKLGTKLMEQSYNLGYPKACYALATWYLHGAFGYNLDYKKAVILLKTAAKNGINEAFYNLAVSYETGRGVRKNESKAFQYYLNSSLNGDADSILAIGRCYYYGIGIETNKAVAKIWLNKAKELGLNW